MAKPIYYPGSKESQRVGVLLRLDKIETLYVKPGKPADDNIDLFVRHTLDYLPGKCTDRYHLQKDSNSLSISKFSCSGSGAEVPESFSASNPKEATVFFGLQGLFLADVQNPKIIPEPWKNVRDAVLQQVDNEMWHFADPKMDFAREVESRGEWKSFAQFLKPMKDRLDNLIQKKSKIPSLQTAAALLVHEMENQKKTPGPTRLNVLLEKGISEKEQKNIEAQVQAIIGSTYPFIPPSELDVTTPVVFAWVAKRLLYETAAKGQEKPVVEGGPIPLAPIMVTPDDVQMAFQQKLTMGLLDEKTAAKDIEEIRRNYLAASWQGKQADVSIGLVSIKFMGEMQNIILMEFDEKIARPAFKNLLAQSETLEKGKKEMVAQRIAVLSGDATKIHWERINEYKVPTKTSLLSLASISKKENLADMSALEFVKEKLQERSKKNPGKLYSLSAQSVYEITFELANLSKEGLENSKLNPHLARKILEKLLQLGEGDYLQLEEGAQEALILGLLVFPDLEVKKTAPPVSIVAGTPTVEIEKPKKKPEEDSFYETWWFWTAAGVLLTAAGGGAYALWGRKNGGEFAIPPLTPHGDTTPTDDNANDTADDSDDNDDDDTTPANNNRRGRSKTVGP